VDLSSKAPVAGQTAQVMPVLENFKTAITLFVHAKHQMNSAHQFSLVVLLDSAVMVHEFTNDVAAFLHSVHTLEPAGEFTSFDVSSLFDVLAERAQAAGDMLPLDAERLPSFTLRAIFLYQRSNVVPEFKTGREAC